MKIYKDRWKNKGLWISLFALIGFVLKNFMDIDMGVYNEFVTLMLAVLIGLGVISDPREGTGYGDTKEEI